MKWFFLIAVLFNIAFFSYENFFHTKKQDQKKEFNKAENHQIVLLNELDSVQLKKLQDQVILTDKENSNNEPLADNSESTVEQKIPFKAQQNKKNICLKLGPFSKNVMDGMKLTLEKEYKNKLSFEIATTSTTTYYRIYIPPLASKEKRKETLKILDKNGLKDHYVMSINGRKNAIALGVFKKISAAEKVAKKTNKAGFATTIEAITDDKNTQYILQLLFRANQDLTFYNELIKQKKLKSTKCEKNS
jgi:hypothetical protein